MVEIYEFKSKYMDKEPTRNGGDSKKFILLKLPDSDKRFINNNLITISGKKNGT